ncbi:MAG TPA: DUF5700 domain-containing putative Zn-dependent protease [Candidatus Angelobacter sp.]|nr:DUF5700 domain-containing putative Zn-dependent protease [Candidatus Angelobacter sp.]
MPRIAIVVAAFLCACLTSAYAAGTDRIDLKLDTSEAEAALTIIDKNAAHQQITDDDWKRLFTSEPYTRLKKREASFRRDFTDDQFKKFVLSDSLASARSDFHKTLAEWKKANLTAVAAHPLAYLPAEAKIRAKVYPVIKPRTNSFVFEATTDPAIFLYLDPAIPQPQFENTVAHELHHIGLSSLSAAYEEKIKILSPEAHKVAHWMGAFGEGMAMLAAAGSPDVSPVADFPQSDQSCWQQDTKIADTELDQINQFFLDIVHGDYKNLEAADHEAYTFFGYRGPWYVVGYKMATTIERQFGRATLVETLKDPRAFMLKYNQAASAINTRDGDKLAMFSPEILEAVGVKPENPSAGKGE